MLGELYSMKLGGITWWRNNYGSILQALALQEVLNNFDNIEYEIICQYGKSVISSDNLVSKIKEIGFFQTCKRGILKFGLKKLRERNKKIQAFVNEYLKISDDTYNEGNIVNANKKYDGFICGSDQIWNPTMTSLSSMYWLGFADDNKLRLSYAPSIGVTNLSETEKEYVKRNLKCFKAISCREDNGTKLINDALEMERCMTVLDPTLLIDREYWDELSMKRKINGEYIFVYILRGNTEQRKMIEKYAHTKKLKIVTIPFLEADHIQIYDLKFGDVKVWDASPAEFISLIRNANYVFTDSFHCMVFSCLYKVNFWTFPKKGIAQMDRITGLQNKLNIHSRVITEKMDVCDIDRFDSIDWCSVDASIEKGREESMNYLKRALYL